MLFYHHLKLVFNGNTSVFKDTQTNIPYCHDNDTSGNHAFINDARALVQFPDNGIFSAAESYNGLYFLCMLLQGLNQMRKVAQVGLDGVRRIDWHDYEAMRRDAARSGIRPNSVLTLLFCLGAFAENICSVSTQSHTHTHCRIIVHLVQLFFS